MRIGIDFDHTVFDTGGFYKEIEERVGVDQQLFKDTFQQVYDEHDQYDISAHAELLRERADVAVEEQDIRSVYDQAPAYVQEDEWITETAENHTLIAVTRRSHRGWQQQKIRSAGLDAYLDEIRVVSGDPENGGETKYFEDLDVLVDDNPVEVQSVRGEGLPVIPIDRYSRLNETYQAVKTLKEAGELITGGGYEDHV